MGVFFSASLLTILAIVLNFDLAKDAGLIALDKSFVLIVRVLMVIWLIVAFCVGYFFVLHGIRIVFFQQTPPRLLMRLWAALTIAQLIICLVCFFIAFVTVDVYPLKVLFTSAFAFTIAASLLTLAPLIYMKHLFFFRISRFGCFCFFALISGIYTFNK